MFAELEKKYGLTYSFEDAGKALQKAVELMSRPGLKEEWKEKRQQLLSDKIDVAEFMLDFINHCSSPKG